MTATEPPRRRRGIYEIGDDQLARLLQLPPGQQVVSVSSNWRRLSLMIMAEGDGLPEVCAGGETPLLNKWARFGPLAPTSVDGLSPAAAHAAVLAELGAVRFEDPAALAGRRRILDRHAPSGTFKAWPACSNCVGEAGGDPYEWPCEDYLDAAAGLVAGLPRQGAHEQDAARAAIAGAVTMLSATAADLALLADPATGTAVDALVFGTTGAALDAATAGPDETPLRDRIEQPRRHRRRPPGGRPEETDPTAKEG